MKSNIRAMAGLLVLLASTGAASARDFLLLQSTTSTQNSGLYEHLLPQFTKATGIDVRVVAVGTGQAIKNAQNCDADVLIVHARAREEAFVAAGYGVERVALMHNDFVIVGPNADPAAIRSQSVEVALAAIKTAKARFTSRGDDSGTHIRERALWADADLAAPSARENWYFEVGAGMGATLNIAVELGAYALTDRSTWLSFANKRRHEILVENDTRLFNPYSVILVNPDHCPNVQHQKAETFESWLTSTAGKAAINSYRVQEQQLFFAVD